MVMTFYEVKIFKRCLFDILFLMVCVHKESHGRRKSCEVKSMSTHNFPLTEPCASVRVSVCVCVVGGLNQ